MADERPEPTPAPEPEPIAAEPAAEPTVEELKAQLEEAQHARQLYEETMASLSATRVPAAAPASSQPGAGVADPYVAGLGITRGDMERIKAEAGFASDDEVVAAVKWAKPIFEALARPVVGYMGAMADIMDRHEAKLSVDGYKELEGEVEEEVAKMRARGSHLPRTELAQIARAKKLPAILKREQETKQAAKKAAASARRAEAIETSDVKVAPTPGTRTKTTVDDIKALSDRDARIKALEEAAGNRPV